MLYTSSLASKKIQSRLGDCCLDSLHLPAETGEEVAREGEGRKDQGEGRVVTGIL